jgi:ATPase subunit of ABC transporter with duplicated ATPase domains
MNYLSVENISKSYGENAFENISFGISKDQKLLYKKRLGKTTIMSIINGR